MDQLGWEGDAWIVVWRVTVENASLDRTFEFIPFLMSYITEVRKEDGTAVEGIFNASEEAAKELIQRYALIWWTDYNTWDEFDFPYLNARNPFNSDPEPTAEDLALVEPGETASALLASYVPGPEIIRVGYSFNLNPGDPSATTSSGPAIWRTTENTDDQLCPGEVTPGPEGFDGVPLISGEPGDVRLVHWDRYAQPAPPGSTTGSTFHWSLALPTWTRWVWRGSSITPGRIQQERIAAVWPVRLIRIWGWESTSRTRQ
jgi:hypothetical protein